MTTGMIKPVLLPPCPVCDRTVEGLTYDDHPGHPRLASLVEVTTKIEPHQFNVQPCGHPVRGYWTSDDRVTKWIPETGDHE